MITKLLHHLRLVPIGLILGLAANGVTHAGLVRGTWDPGFGPALPGLNWTARADLLVPNACSAQADGIYANAGPCAGSIVLGVFLRLYDTGYPGPLDWDGGLAIYFSDPPGAASYEVCNPSASGDPYYVARCLNGFAPNGPNPYYGVSNIRVVSGNVVGFDSNVPFGLTYDTSLGFPTNALGNGFSLNFGVNGPLFACVTAPTCADPIAADTANLTQFVVTYLSGNGETPSDTSQPKFTDSNGNALGAVLDGNGNYLGQATRAQVPEPGTLALALAALTSIGWWRRRRA